jgi:alpha-methylacyl-CoA racemase
MRGPLNFLKVVEFSGLGPGPLAGQLLADLGADVITIDRKSAQVDPSEINRRNKRSIALNLKSKEGLKVVKKIIDNCDVLIEGFRPGVMEKLGIAPSDCHDKLVYGRMTGWGQSGKFSKTAGHDINYLGITGALHAIGTDETPIPPLNLVADYGGGSMFLIFGILAALYERNTSGKGQVVDAAMVDGVPAMMGLFHQFVANRNWLDGERESNLLDGGAPFYRCYKCADGKFISVGALEPQFFAELGRVIELPEIDLKTQNDKATWPHKNKAYEKIFKSKSRDEWAKIFEGLDACVTPILTLEEATKYPANSERNVFFEQDGIIQASPAPRFDRTPNIKPQRVQGQGANSEEILKEIGLAQKEIIDLKNDNILT